MADLLAREGFTFTSQKHVNFHTPGLTYAYIDFTIEHNGMLVCLEVDEGQHSLGYTVSCDVKRMANIVITPTWQSAACRTSCEPHDHWEVFDTEHVTVQPRCQRC